MARIFDDLQLRSSNVLIQLRRILRRDPRVALAPHDQRRRGQVFEARAEVAAHPVAQQSEQADVPLGRLQCAAVTAQHVGRYLRSIEPGALDRAGVAIVIRQDEAHRVLPPALNARQADQRRSEAAVRAAIYRRIDQHEAAHPIGIAQREVGDDAAAHRIPGQHRPIDLLRVQKRLQAIGLRVLRHGLVPALVAETEAAHVRRINREAGISDRVQVLPPRKRRRPKAVHQHDRHITRSGLLIIHPRVARLHERAIRISQRRRIDRRRSVQRQQIRQNENSKQRHTGKAE